MKDLISRRTQLVTVAILLLASPALAGVVYEIETKDHEHSPPMTETTEVAVEGPRIYMSVAPGRKGGQGKMIFRGDRGDNGEVIVTDDDDKSYYVMDDATVEALAGQVGAAMGAMQEALKNLPKEQRDAIEKAMKEGGMPGGMGSIGGPKRSAPEVRKTGERATHAGYPCVKYEVVRDGRKIRELWVTDWSNVEGGGEAREAFAGLIGFFQAMIDSLPELPGGADPFDGVDSYAESFGNGFPVVTRSFDEGGDLAEESTLRSARRRSLDPSEFEPPAGYKRRTMLGAP